MKHSSELAESKLVIIYLLHKMNLPVSISYIQEFALDSEVMDYFSLSYYIADLNENGYISKNIENNKTSYTVTEKGYKILDLFENLIPSYVKEKIDKYVDNNKNQLKKEIDITANYQKLHDEEYSIKCGAYENGTSLMEINLKVISKKYARAICDNWKKNAPDYYVSFIKSLLEGKEDF